MTLHRLSPAPSESYDLTQETQRRAFLAPLTPPTAVWTRAVMVTNSAGATRGGNGTSGSLSAGEDRAVLRLLRGLSDAVVVGAGTLHAERVPVPADKTLVILSHTGVIAAENIIPSTSGYGDILVLTGTQGHSVVEQTLRDVPHRVALIPPGASAQDLAALIRHEVGGGSLLIEGGQKVWQHFQPLCDDLWLAVTPPPLSAREGRPLWWPLPPSSTPAPRIYTDEARMLYYHHHALRGAPPES